MPNKLVPGAVLPDYQLPDHTGTVRRLSELQGDDPMILTLARGHYCPKEHQQHLELAAFYPKIARPTEPEAKGKTIQRAPISGHRPEGKDDHGSP